MKLRNLLAIALILGSLSACSLPRSDMKSPCVGAQGSPCDRHPVNDWWMKNHQNEQS